MFPSLIIFVLFPIFSLSQNVQQFNDCSFKLFSCGEIIPWIGYPFWGDARPSYCGLPQFHLTCRGDNVTTIQIINTTFRVLRIDQTELRITLAQNDLWEEPDVCSLRQQDTVNNTVFSYIPNEFLLLRLHLSCSEDEVNPIPARKRLNCTGNGGGSVSFIEDGMSLLGCKREIRVPVFREIFEEFNQSETMPLEEVLQQGFPMNYRDDDGGICSRCQNSGGTCWSNLNSSFPSCLCPGGISRLVCLPSGTWYYPVLPTLA